MNTLKRHKFGGALVAISVVAWAVFLVVGLFNADWHYVGGGSGDNAQVMAYDAQLKINGYYFIPIFLCGATGAACLLWPSRKPPKIQS